MFWYGLTCFVLCCLSCFGFDDVRCFAVCMLFVLFRVGLLCVVLCVVVLCCLCLCVFGLFCGVLLWLVWVCVALCCVGVVCLP